MSSRIAGKFRELRKKNGKAFIPYIMAGDPNIKRTRELISLLEGCGADIIELGVPFSDPLADGPTIQQAAQRALDEGVTLKKVIAFVAELRAGTQIPIILMTYYNPIFKYGEERFVLDATAAGVDGVIVPDLPPDEAGNLMKHARKSGLDTIFLLAPTSTDDRIRKVVKDIYGVYLLRADYRDYRFQTFSGRVPWAAYSTDKKFFRQAGCGRFRCLHA